MDVEAFFEQHHTSLLRYLIRYTGDPEEAADALQEAYLRMLERPPERDDNLRGWLFVVATRSARDGRRKRHREVLGPDREDRIAPGESDHDALAEVVREERCATIRRMLARLSGRERTVLLMRGEGFTHREIAQAVGTTTGSVGTMIARALDKLARELGDKQEEYR